MKRTSFIQFCALCLFFAVSFFLLAENSHPAPSPSDQEIRAKQALGRAIASPDGKFFLYEWTRPYDWDRAFDSLPPNVPAHMQTWLYKVDTDLSPSSSEYLFYPMPGCSYWLGALSPDAKKVSFYVLDEENHLKAGVYDLVDSKFTWFTMAPEGRELDHGPFWVSNQELVYVGASGKAVRGNLATGEAKPCPECQSLFEKAKAASQATGKEKIQIPTELGPGTKLLSASKDGGLKIYAKDTPDTLSLIFQRGSEKPETLFENKRHD